VVSRVFWKVTDDAIDALDLVFFLSKLSTGLIFNRQFLGDYTRAVDDIRAKSSSF